MFISLVYITKYFSVWITEKGKNLKFIIIATVFSCCLVSFIYLILDI